MNGTEAALVSLPQALVGLRDGEAALNVLVAAQADVTAQRLTDLLVALRAVPGTVVTVMEAS